MWVQLSRVLVKVPHPRKGPWDSYPNVPRAVEVSEKFSPLLPKSLHPINRCNAVDIEDSVPGAYSPQTPRNHTLAQRAKKLPAGSRNKITSVRMKFRCPLVLEALSLVEPGVAACHLCNRRVYKVRTQEELAERARKGDCVWMEHQDLDPEARVEMDVEVALFTEDFDQAVKALSTVAADPRVVERSTSMFPFFVVKITDGFRTIQIRFTTFCFPSDSDAGEALDATLGQRRTEVEMASTRSRFLFLWFQPPSTTDVAERASWVQNLTPRDNGSPAETVKLACAKESLDPPIRRRSWSAASPNAFVTQVLKDRPDDFRMMGAVSDEVAPPPTLTCCQKIASSCRSCCSVQ
jgi:hypothetical protein